MQCFSLLFYHLAKWSSYVGLIFFCVSCINDESLEYTPVFDIPPTCNDGLKNQDETSTDCGGACSFFCGNSILASCTDDLAPNHVENSLQSISFDINEIYSKSSYQGLDIISYGNYRHNKLTITLPIDKLPLENMKFPLGTEAVMDEGNLQARVVLENDDFGSYHYGYERISVSGTIYLKLVDDKIHLEFCDISLKEEYFSYTQSFKGNINLLTELLDI